MTPNEKLRILMIKAYGEDTHVPLPWRQGDRVALALGILGAALLAVPLPVVYSEALCPCLMLSLCVMMITLALAPPGGVRADRWHIYRKEGRAPEETVTVEGLVAEGFDVKLLAARLKAEVEERKARREACRLAVDEATAQVDSLISGGDLS